MKSHRQLILTLALALTAAISAGVAMSPDSQQEPAAAQAAAPAPPMPPAPSEHHKWLQQLVGNWTVQSEMAAPGMDPIKSTGTESVRSIGGRWVVAEFNAEIPGMGPMNAVHALGYDSEKGKYQGTWIDSVTDQLWVYTGTLDATGKILTLEAEGPNMMNPAAGPTRYRDVHEIKSADLRTLTSSAFADGKWVQFGTGTYRRTK